MVAIPLVLIFVLFSVLLSFWRVWWVAGIWELHFVPHLGDPPSLVVLVAASLALTAFRPSVQKEEDLPPIEQVVMESILTPVLAYFIAWCLSSA